MSVAKRKNTETRSCGSGGGDIRHSHSSGHTAHTHSREGSAQAEHSTSDVDERAVQSRDERRRWLAPWFFGTAYALFALSFVPYFFPEDIKPDAWKARDPVEIGHARLAKLEATDPSEFNSRYLGGDIGVLDELFPPEAELP